MYPMANLSQTLPKRETRRILNNKTTTITLIQETTRQTLFQPQSILRALLKTRKAKGQDRVKEAMEAAPSTLIIRRMKEQRAMAMQPITQELIAQVHLMGPLRTPTPQDKGQDPSTPTLAAKLQEAPSTTSTNRMPCKTCRTLSLLPASATKFKCTK